MGRIFSELVGNEIIVTRYESNGFVIPDRLSQDKINIVNSVMSSNIDSDDSMSCVGDDSLAVSRRDFIFKLLSMSDSCIERYSEYCKDLYSYDDMSRGITLCEVAYLIYYVGGVSRTLDWGSINPGKSFKVCVLQELDNSRKVINEKLAMYKNRLDMDSYIKSMRTGARYIPLPLYCAFVDFMNNGDVDIVTDESFFFKKLSKSELDRLF